jgi:chromosome segregation ATPase
MGEPSSVELETRIRFLEAERELETARVMRLEQEVARLRLMEPEVARLRREQVLHPEIEANFQSVNARIENRFTILSNQIADANNRLQELSVVTESVRTLQRQLNATVREGHSRVMALDDRMGSFEERITRVEAGQVSIIASLADMQTTLRRIAGDAPPEAPAQP